MKLSVKHSKNIYFQQLYISLHQTMGVIVLLADFLTLATLLNFAVLKVILG